MIHSCHGSRLFFLTDNRQLITDDLLASRKYRLDAAQSKVDDDKRIGDHQGRIDLADAQDVRLFVNVNFAEPVKTRPVLGFGWSKLGS